MNSQESNLPGQDPVVGQQKPAPEEQRQPHTPAEPVNAKDEATPPPVTQPAADGSHPTESKPAAPAPETAKPAESAESPAPETAKPAESAESPAPETAKPAFSVGDRIWGQVLRMTDTKAVVALGEQGLEEGQLDLVHLRDKFGNLSLSDGDEVQAYVTAVSPAIALAPSLLPPSNEVYEKLKAAKEADEIIPARVMGLNRGGLELDVEGQRAFCPYSHIEIGRCENPEIYVNHILDFKVVELDEEKKRAVLSRRPILEAERREKLHEILAEVKEGAESDGVVTRLQPFGAFVDIGGVEGLVHVSEMSFDRIAHPKEVVRRGEKVRVKVLGVTHGKDGKERIRLSMKALMQDPWLTIDNLFNRNDIVTGLVTRITDFGAFVKLHPGIEGLLHVSEYKPREGESKPSAAQKTTADKTAAAEPATTGEPTGTTEQPATEAEKPAATTEQPATTAEKPAAMTEQPATEAEKPAATDQPNATDENPAAEGVPVTGAEITVRIARIDRERRRISLSLQDESRDRGKKEHDASVGEVHTGVVRNIKPYGVFVDLPTVGPWVSGLLPISETGLDRGANLNKTFSEGQEVKIEIIEIDDRGRLRLSQKSLIEGAEEGSRPMKKGGLPTAPPGGFNVFAEAMKRAQEREKGNG